MIRVNRRLSSRHEPNGVAIFFDRAVRFAGDLGFAAQIVDRRAQLVGNVVGKTAKVGRTILPAVEHLVERLGQAASSVGRPADRSRLSSVVERIRRAIAVISSHRTNAAPAIDSPPSCTSPAPAERDPQGGAIAGQDFPFVGPVDRHLHDVGRARTGGRDPSAESMRKMRSPAD